MTRYLPRLLLTGALLSPATLYALGLGEIRLNSALNQPFNAEIELISPTPQELSSLKVGLASNELFARYGIDRPAFLSTFTFALGRSSDGRPTIKVTSSRNVTDPFVTLLVEVISGRSRNVREYTVLLDPPVFMPAQPQSQAPVTTPQTGVQNEGRIERPQSAAPTPQPRPAAPAVRPEPTSSAPSLGTSYTVERNDTLWKIASRLTPGSPRTVNRTMVGLFRANPSAFGGNINRLRAGSVLRIPDMADIEAISAGDASAEVARQMSEWSGGQAPVRTAEDTSRLRLVPPEQTPAAPATSPTPPTAQQPERTASLPPGAPGAPTDRRLSLPAPGASEVQRNVSPPVEQPTPAPAPTPAPPAAEQPTTPPTEAAPQAAPEPAPAVQQPPAQPATQAASEPAPSLADRIGDYWWVAVAAGLLVVLGLVLAVKRRREAAEHSVDAFSSLDFEPRAARAEPTVATKSRTRPESFVVQEQEDDTVQDFDEPPATPTVRREPAKVTPIEPQRAGDETISSDTAVRFDQQDALAEADFHMAYGLYDQAADLVKIAIDREPTRRDLKLKLLEIYFVWGNKDLFLDTARDLHGSRDRAEAGEWDKVLIMGKQIAPDDAMFKGEAAPHMDLVDVNLEGGENRVDVDLFAEPEADKPSGLDLEFTSGEHKAPGAGGDSDLDFLLDEPKRGADEEPTREMAARTQEIPTIESPVIDRDRVSQTIREKIDKTGFGKISTEQTAELSLDDLGLDVDSLETTGSLEDTTALTDDDSGETELAPGLRDDDKTQLAPAGLGNLDRTFEVPQVRKRGDTDSTGTIYIDQVDLAQGDTVEQRRPDVDSTASMPAPDLDINLDNLEATQESSRTVRKPRAAEDRFSSEVFADATSEIPKIDLDIGDSLGGDDNEPTNRQVITSEMELSELEPVTMSEVGTKLDLARAYMDMGDPDGARSILEEVLQEGNPNQKQEAQRLIESIR
jgi:pilus assembly protein FimV